ncbi:hypothetical protein BAE44_0019152 [Dichanthelium oligosanthes]|uniref:RING-type E3 ubiquitin transferase n=1 Tax=Dichanthelium oligosanthes TaxID=888268 RepID=A0A1E5V3V8_9POAL|nr:hypothetical protein BAE44_0019152 [Dichanthelium oligosanthes]
MAAALLSLTSLYIYLGVVAGLVALCAVVWAVCRCSQDGSKEGGVGGGVSSATGKHEVLLNKKNKDAVVAVPQQVRGGAGGQQRGANPPGDDNGGDVELCAICKARLAEAGWGPCRRLRPCGHVFHADCIDLWLQRKWICPVCRAGVVVSRTEIVDAMV